MAVTINLDLNQNDADALFRHCKEHKPNSGDHREDARLREALQALQEAIICAQAQDASRYSRQ